VQNLKGKDGPPTTEGDEVSPCAHADTYEAQLEMLCALAQCAKTDINIKWDENDCKDFREVLSSWLASRVECDLVPYQIPELPTVIPEGYQLPEPPCEPEGC
jgi:hypothetical protein